MSHIHAELGEVIAGKKNGRTNNEEVIVFDSTGMGFRRGLRCHRVSKGFERKRGLKLDFSK